MSTIGTAEKPKGTNPDLESTKPNPSSFYQGAYDILLTFFNGRVLGCMQGKKDQNAYWVRISWMGGHAMIKSAKRYEVGVFKKMVCSAEIQMDESYKPTGILEVDY